jgi:hypothetical protein
MCAVWLPIVRRLNVNWWCMNSWRTMTLRHTAAWFTPWSARLDSVVFNKYRYHSQELGVPITKTNRLMSLGKSLIVLKKPVSEKQMHSVSKIQCLLSIQVGGRYSNHCAWVWFMFCSRLQYCIVILFAIRHPTPHSLPQHRIFELYCRALGP